MNKKPPYQYNKSSHSKTKYHKYPAKNNKLLMIPLIIMVAVIPLIVRYLDYHPGLSNFNWFPTEDSNFDFFLYYKQLYFVITCSIMLILIGYRIYQDKSSLKFSPIFIPLGLYGFLALLSTFFSKYSSFGFTGIYEQFESIFVILGYCLIVYYAFLFIDTEDDVQLVFHFFLISVSILGLLGISQAFGQDFFATDVGLKTILPSNIWSRINDFNFTFGKNRVYLTLYNPNYVGVYVALVAPIIICLILTSRKPKTILLYIAALIGLMISLYGSKSKAGLVGFIASLFFILIFLRNYIFRKSRFMVPIIVVGIITIVFIGSLKYDLIYKRVNNLMNTEKAEKHLTDIRTEEDIIIFYQGNELRVNYKQNSENELSFNFTDGNNQEVDQTLNVDTGSYDILDERFAGFNAAPVVYNDLLCVKVQIDDKDWLFSNQLGDETYYYINRFGRPDKIVTADSTLFTGFETFATGRGYIWSRTLPLLRKYLFLGSGADSFSIVFPQQDYINLYNYGFSDQIITKPHSMYLQIGVQTGVLSLLAFIVFYSMYFFSSITLYRKGHFDDLYSQAGVAIFIGTISYMITGFSNDSSITVSPVFWVMIGIGININLRLK